MRTEILEVAFRALPGRAQWVADPARISKGIFRTPAVVPIPPRTSSVTEVVDLPEPAEVQREAAGAASNLAVEIAPDVRDLVDHLTAVGEADASEIKDFRPDLDVEEFVKLLARARRAKVPRVRNYGSRTRPRWVAVGSKGDHVISIAREPLSRAGSRWVRRRPHSDRQRHALPTSTRILRCGPTARSRSCPQQGCFRDARSRAGRLSAVCPSPRRHRRERDGLAHEVATAVR